MPAKADIIAHARQLVGIPWIHLGRNPATGLDCVGLMLEAAERAGFSIRQYDEPAYSRIPDGKTLQRCLERGADCVPIAGSREEGDIGVFWFTNRRYPTHVAFFAKSPTIDDAWNLIHSYSSGPRKVVENVCDEYWSERLHSVWRLR